MTSYKYFYNYIAVTCYILVAFYLIMQINFEISSHNFGFRSIKFLIKLKLMFWLGFLGILALLVNILKDSINIVYFYTSLSHHLQISRKV